MMAEHGLDWVMVGDGSQISGWLTRSEVEGAATVGGLTPKPIRTTLTPDSSLRDALDAIVSSHSRVAAVFEDGRYLGILTLDQLSEEVLR